MKNLLLITAAFLMTTGAAIASPGHGKMKVGEPGKADKVDRVVEILMKETDDGDMLFEPNNLKVEKGETIRFVIKNVGELEHEFVLDTHEEVQKHKVVMEKFPEMEHEDDNSLRLDEGKNGEIIWKFSNGGDFQFACLIPGHYESGMKGEIKVSGH